MAQGRNHDDPTDSRSLPTEQATRSSGGDSPPDSTVELSDKRHRRKLHLSITLRGVRPPYVFSQFLFVSALIVSGAVGSAEASAAGIPISLVNGALTATVPSGTYALRCGQKGTLEINGAETTPRATCADQTAIAVVFSDDSSTLANIVDYSGLLPAAFPKLAVAILRYTANEPRSPVTFVGSPISDIVTVGGGSNVDGRAGDDSIDLGTGNGGVALGGEGGDFLSNRFGGPDTRLEGGPGNDGFAVSGAGIAFGGDGNDRFDAPNSSTSPVLDGGPGDDSFTAQMRSGSITIRGGDGVDRFITTGTSIGDTSKVRPTATGVRATQGTLNAVADGVELLTYDYPSRTATNAALDVVMMPTIAVQARVYDPNIKVLVRVPGGVWTRNDAAQTVTAPGLKKFSWVVVAAEPPAPANSIIVKIQAR
jgi:hypothetical protein